MIRELERALKQQKNIQVIYLGKDGHTTMRTLRPLEVTGERLKAYCLTRKAPRIFAIDNILAAEPVESGHAV
ncbi:WYL domain-containing protein [Brevibacillus sp. SIMBA_040]|uniref:WYL domain-containing protein n=1 Tax=unclassified Brevibacillus TaxID=2684853 RepID=UPI003977EF20